MVHCYNAHGGCEKCKTLTGSETLYKANYPFLSYFMCVWGDASGGLVHA